ncbi:MAG: hypothetical protein HN712_13415 [Gemmatimonadetes bacterium]|jgi:cytochrome c oxidase subunit I|nr:hypothetical protein [Gemmatimonadota bacterium]MBT6148393.1 hypothetical protein [Gemmatimonadota bacterium]MBT7861314.1 hypothetical protein [Gemmatimonadota bacterium]
MQATPSGFDARRIPALHLLLILALGGLALLAQGLVRFEYLVPDRAIIDALLFSQLLGVHEVVLKYFVLLPVIPTVFGLALLPTMIGVRQLAFPKLAVGALALHALAAVLLVLAFLQAKVEPGWAYAVGSSTSITNVSATFLVSLALMFMTMQLTALNLIVTIYRVRRPTLPPFVSSLYWAGWLMLIVLPVALSAIVMALAESTLSMGMFDAARGGMPTLLPWVFGLTSTPMQAIVLLPVLGLAATILSPEETQADDRSRRTYWYMAAFALLSLPAFDLRAMPGDLSWLTTQLGAFFKALMLVPLFPLALNLARTRLAPWTVARLYALAALALIILFAPLDLFLNLGGATAIFGTGYLADGHFRMMIAGSCLLIVLGGGHHFLRSPMLAGGNVATFVGIVLLFSLMATHLPMLIIGQHAIPSGYAVYPARFLPLQVLITFGGVVFVTSLIAGVLQLARRVTYTS